MAYIGTFHINESVCILVKEVEASRVEAFWAVVPRSIIGTLNAQT